MRFYVLVHSQPCLLFFVCRLRKQVFHAHVCTSAVVADVHRYGYSVILPMWSESVTLLICSCKNDLVRAHFRRIWRFDQYKTLDSTNIHIGRILYWSYPRPAYIQCTLDSAFEALAQIGQPRRTAFQQGNLTPKSGRHDDSRIQIFYSVHIALFFFFFFLPSSLTFISFFKETGFSS